MASIRRHRDKWQVQIRLLGSQYMSKTFHRKADAQHWAVETEAKIQRGEIQDGLQERRRTTLRELLERYRDTVTIKKRGRYNETYMIQALLRQKFSDLTLAQLKPLVFSAYRNERSKSVRGVTINRELTLLSHLFNTAKSEWGIPVNNPIAGIRRAENTAPRCRRLEAGEFETLMKGLDQTRNRFIKPVILFAIETAMRRGEILKVEWSDIDWSKQTLNIPVTKTGRPRTIPLTATGVSILSGQHKLGLVRPFPLTMEAFKLAWQRLIDRTKLKDLHFHDLRHEAISRLFERGLTIPEVSLISGHRDVRMLFRYTHLKPEDVGAKLWALELAREAKPPSTVSQTPALTTPRLKLVR